VERILTTHAGSLIRPPELLEFLVAKERGEPFHESAYANASGKAASRRVWFVA
jgi:hypothetical protein